MKPYSGESSRLLIWLMSVVLLLVFSAGAKAQHFFYIDNYIGGNYNYCNDYKLSSKYLYLEKKNHTMEPMQKKNKVNGYGVSLGKELNVVFGKRINDPDLRYTSSNRKNKKTHDNQYESTIALATGLHINAQGYNVKYEDASSYYTIESYYWLSSVSIPLKIKWGNFSRLSSTPFLYDYIYFGAQYNIPLIQSYVQIPKDFDYDTYYDEHSLSRELPHYFSFFFGINFLAFDVSIQYSPKLIEFDFTGGEEGNLLEKRNLMISVLLNIPRKH